MMDLITGDKPKANLKCMLLFAFKTEQIYV